MQFLPLPDGTGLSHVLCRRFRPVPQVAEQSLQDFQPDQPPSVISIIAHSLLKQRLTSSEFPGHVFPVADGTGLLHNLSRCFRPVPQVTEQALHDAQSDQPPSLNVCTD